jgi:hypothetical protein
MIYDEIISKQKAYNDRENEWLDQLWDATVRLRVMLTTKLEIDETYGDGTGRSIHYMRLLEAQVKISEAEPLSRKYGLPVDSHGAMPFAIELKLRLHWGDRPIYIFLGEKIEKGTPMYAGWHLPGELPPRDPKWVDGDEMVTLIVGEIQRYLDHDPSTGSRKDCFIY